MKRDCDLESVSNDQLLEAYQFCQDGIAALHKDGLTYPEMALRMHVAEPALKQFIRRGKLADAVPIRRGAAFQTIYRYLVQAQRRERTPLAASILESMAKLKADNPHVARALVYSLLMEMLTISAQDQTRAAERVYKRLYAFRNAAIQGYVVKSEITFTQVLLEGDARIWEFKHRFVDDNRINKESDGLAIAINKTIYLLGDIQSSVGDEQSSEGLDLLVLRKPIDKAEVMPGFHISIDDDRPLFSNSVLLDADYFDSVVKQSNKSHKCDKTGVFPKKLFAETGMFGTKESAEVLFQQLSINVTEGVLRVGLREVIDLALIEAV